MDPVSRRGLSALLVLLLLLAGFPPGRPLAMAEMRGQSAPVTSHLQRLRLPGRQYLLRRRPRPAPDPLPEAGLKRLEWRLSASCGADPPGAITVPASPSP